MAALPLDPDGISACVAPAPQTRGSVLIVDDEIGMQGFLQRALRPHFARVDTASGADEARARALQFRYDFLIADIHLPGSTSGLDLARELRERSNADLRVVFITGYADLYAEIEGLRDESAEVLRKPFHVEHLLALIDRASSHSRSLRENYLLRRETRAQSTQRRIIGESGTIREIWETIERIAPTSSTILIKGETGTGKELVARALHEHSGRSGSYVPVNCGAISAELIEDELFGHLKGAFTGALQARNGLFSHADGGTLFLDEIGEMPLALQAKLLRVLEQRCYRPVGSNQEIPVNARVIAATNRDLASEVEAGRFRKDLYYRINVVEIRLPPLRDRKCDIPYLARHFLDSLSAELGVSAPRLHDAELERLVRYDWPGNIRELRNVIERALLLGKLPSCCLSEPGMRVDASELESNVLEGADANPQSLAHLQRTHILSALLEAGGNKSAAARRLGVSRKTVERKLKEWAARPVPDALPYERRNPSISVQPPR